MSATTRSDEGMEMTPRDSFVEAVREANAACPCLENEAICLSCSNRPSAIIDAWHTENCRWPGHAALRKAAVAVGDQHKEADTGPC